MMRVLIVDVGAQSEKDEPLIVCANSEGVMRVIDPDGACAAGERKIPLRLPKVELPCEKAREADIGALQRRIAELEGRADERLLDRKALAPFEVVNEAGIVVFSVKGTSPGDHVAATEIFNDTGGRVAVIAANSEGGSVSVESGVNRAFTGEVDGPAVSANLHTFGNYADLSLTVVAEKKLELGRRENGRYALRLFGAQEKVVAGFGESEGGAGIALVADANGNPRAAINLLTEGGSGVARIIDGAGKEVATLSGAGAAGSGLLQLRNNADTVMVEAGVLDTGIGVVRAGPGAFQHGKMFVGLPASWIEGRK
jgi:hypothetical protein